MRCVRLIEPIGVEGLQIVEEDELPLGHHDVRLRIHAVSLNFRDMSMLRGYQQKDTPIPLSDGAGEVIEVGAGVTQVVVGDRVVPNCYPRWRAGPFLEEYNNGSLGWTIDGMLAESIVLDEGALVRIPAYLSYAEAATLPCAAVSAWSALNVHEPLRAGQVVLIQGTGGVALFGAQLAIAHGATVLAISSQPERADVLREIGVKSVINYNEVEDWHLAILEQTDGRGVDKVVEIAGEKTLRKSIACTRLGGEVGVVGFVTGVGPAISATDVMVRHVRLEGVRIGSRLSLEHVVATLESAQLRPKIAASFAFEDYASAYKYMIDGHHVGKVVVDFSL